MGLTGGGAIGFFYWGADDNILYGGPSNIMRVSSNGGIPNAIVKAENKNIFSPQILPDGESVLFTSRAGTAQMKIMLQSLKSGELRELFAGDTAQYLPTGHIVYATVENNLIAVPFDLKSLKAAGGPVSMVENVGRWSGAPQYAVSNSGTLVYVPGTAAAAAAPVRTLVWVNRDGKEKPIAAPPNDYRYPRISPDGTRLALNIKTGENYDIWIWDLARETMTRLTFEGSDNWPLWTHDGQKIIYNASGNSINIRAADGSGEVKKLASWPNDPGPFALSKDGKTLLSWDYSVSFLQTSIAVMALEGDHARKPLLQGKYNYDHPQISPDGQWLAYASNESGRNEVYVRPYPEINKGRWQVSTNGGNGPLWSPNGRELFYRDGESVMAVAVETEPTFKPGKPKLLFKGTYYSKSTGQSVEPNWDISPDGKRFLMMKEVVSADKPSASTGAAPTEAGPRKINIVVNWFEELKQRVPTK